MTAPKPTSARPATPGEEWRPVVGHEHLYEVSSLGQVRCSSGGTGRVQWRVLKQSDKTPKGYLRVSLWDGTPKKHMVAHLVAKAFLGPRPEGLLVLHNNGCSTDNRLSNLRYGTRSDNAADSIAHGTFRGGTLKGEDNPQAKLTEQFVRMLRTIERPAFGKLARELGVNDKALRQAWAGRTWKYVQ